MTGFFSIAGQLETEATKSTSTTSSSLPSEGGGNYSDKTGHSNSPRDSVALMIQVSTRSIQARLEEACSGGVVDVFSITGRHKTTFPAAYREYIDEVAKLEDNVCQYLKVCYKSCMSEGFMLIFPPIVCSS